MNLDGDGKDSSKGVFGRKRDGGVGGGMGEEEGDMQVTFMPGLSEAAARKARGEKKKVEDGEETTLEKYMRKQREKKEKRKNKPGEEEKKDENEEDEDEGGEGGNLGWDDPFFQEAGEEMDFEAALAAEEGDEPSSKDLRSKKDKRSKKNKQNLSPEKEAELARSKAELELMVDDDSGDELNGGKSSSRAHFNMKDVIRAEKGLDKKPKKSKKYRKNKEDEDERGPGATQPGFEIDVGDSRFSNLLEDHRFALDPSHPSFIKTKGMDKLMEERRKKQRGRMGEDAPREESGKPDGQQGNKEEDWKAIVGRMNKRDRDGEGEKASGGKSANGKGKKRKV